MPSTWDATASNQILTGAALRDGAGHLLVGGTTYIVDVTIPVEDNLKMVTQLYVKDHTTASIDGADINNKLCRKDLLSGPL